jgi:hypothetical protein
MYIHIPNHLTKRQVDAMTSHYSLALILINLYQLLKRIKDTLLTLIKDFQSGLRSFTPQWIGSHVVLRRSAEFFGG